MNQKLKIATVDDMQEARENLAGKIEDYMKTHRLLYKLFHYESGEAFVDALKKERFDIVFMDIFMNGMTGIETAGKLRAVDMDCKLVFLTSSRDFLEEGYGYNPCHYLLKPFDDAKFEKAMYNCQIKRQLEVPFINVVSEGSLLTLDTTKIIYLNTCNRNVLIHMTTGTIPAGRGFSEIAEPLLQDSRFLSCIQGILVNMDFISEVDKNIFLLKNGERLQMTIRNKSSLTRQYHAYQFKKASSREGIYL